MGLEKNKIFQIGAWRVFPDRNEIERDGGTVRIEPMSMRLLTLLLENGERTTTRDEIVERLWNGRVVSDDAITKQISKLRACLGDDPRNPEIIRTVPKVGVRLLCVPEMLPSSIRETATGKKPLAWFALALALIIVVATASVQIFRSPDTRQEFSLTERPLTSAPGLEFDPAISPDGRWLAYAERPTDQPATALFVRAIADSHARRVSAVDSSASMPAWSHDGRVAFVARGVNSCRVLAGSPFGTLRTATACVSVLGLAWLGNEHLVIASQPRFGAAFQLLLVDLTTGSSRILTTPPAGEIGDRLPAISADGRRVYFLRTVTVGIEHVLELDLSSGKIWPIVEESAHVVGLAAQSNGHLLIASDRGRGVIALWQFNIPNRSWRQILPEVSGPISASLDGRRIVFARTQTRTALWRQPLSGGPPEPLTQTTLADRLPVVSRQGALAFVANRSGTHELWRQDVESSVPEQLTRFGGGDVEDPSWSPDGRTIAVAATVHNNFDIYLVDARSGASRRLTNTTTDERHPVLSLDGHTIFFARSDGPNFDLIRRNLTSGRETAVVKGALRAVPVSNDVLVFGRLLKPGLSRVSMSNGQVASIANWPDWSDMRNWTVEQGYIWGVKRSKGQAILVRLDPRNGASRPALQLKGLAPGSGLAIRGAYAIYARQMEAEADIELLEFALQH